jgi:hypothetical protein
MRGWTGGDGDGGTMVNAPDRSKRWYSTHCAVVCIAHPVGIQRIYRSHIGNRIVSSGTRRRQSSAESVGGLWREWEGSQPAKKNTCTSHRRRRRRRRKVKKRELEEIGRKIGTRGIESWRERERELLARIPQHSQPPLPPCNIGRRGSSDRSP